MDLTKREFLQVMGAASIAGMALGRHAHADAALAASVFHFNEHSVIELKRFLADRQIPVRL